MASSQPADQPPLAALFLIEFDVKAGYTVVWKQAVRGLDVGGAVEYKSLPSGLHEVSEDLVYFVHDDAPAAEGGDEDDGDGPGVDSRPPSGGYAGLSAFVNRRTDDADARHARMLAVGVLVPRSHGRLGRVWRHAAALMGLARTLVADRSALPALEAYWQRNNGAPLSDRPLLQIADSPLGSPVSSFPGHRSRSRSRGSSRSSSSSSSSRRKDVATTTTPLHHGLPTSSSHHRLPLHHPAWGLTALLDTFGPLLFPIYRAALLRKRILISTQAPVREVNQFVYNVSVLANIPLSALDLVEPAAAAEQRIRPLFTIGVHDIGFLLQDAAARKGAAAATATGWIACTTDRILATKEDLWDVLVTMPVVPAHGTAAAAVRWPTVVEAPGGVPLLATQRDLRRFRSLTTGLERLAERARSGGRRSQLFRQSDAQRADAAEAVVEPVTWAALAYNGFLWWASAGEQRRTDEMDESIHDAALLADLVAPQPAPAGLEASLPSLRHPGDANADVDADADTNADDASEEEEEERAQMELAIITYFHRLTTQMLSVLADVAERSALDGGGGDGGGHGGDSDSETEAQAASAYYDDSDGDDDEDDDDNDVNDLGYDDSDSVQTGGDEEDDGLLGARRSGLAAAPSTLQLRRRGGGRQTGPSRRTTGPGTSRRRRCRRRTNTMATNASTTTADDTALGIDSDALLRMGLDEWSAADAAFVRGLAGRYFGGRAVRVEGRGVEVCGLRLC